MAFFPQHFSQLNFGPNGRYVQSIGINLMLDLPKSIYQKTDRLLLKAIYSLVDIKLIKRSLSYEAKYFESPDGMGGKVEFLTTWLSTLQTRASASISHISIMLGMTIILLINKEHHPVIVGLMLFEVGLYVLLLLGCLLCVRSFTLNDGIIYRNLRTKFKVELIRRFAAMQVVNSFLVVATLFFFLIIVVVVLSSSSITLTNCCLSVN